MGKLRRRSELARITAEIQTLKSAVGRGIYGIGQRLYDVQTRELWRDGFESFEAYLEEGADVSRTSAYRFMRIAEHFNSEIAARYGVTKLDATLRYMAATKAQEQPGDVFAAVIDVDGEKVTLHEAKAEQIVDAARKLEGRKRRPRIPATVRKKAERLAKRLPSAPAGLGRGKRVRVVKGSDGRLAMTFVAVPLDEIEAFLDALKAEL